MKTDAPVAAFAKTCWTRAAKGRSDPDARETLQGPGLEAEGLSLLELYGPGRV